jgi:CRP/FNR family cyclic AMP-dependent transcriptional regulator
LDSREESRLSASQIGNLRRQIRDADNSDNLPKQISLLQQLCASELNDLRSRQRLGHLLHSAGQTAAAVAELQSCASGYAMEGFLNRSIQIVKALIEIDSSDQQALRALQGLYTRRQSDRPTAGPIPGFKAAPFSQQGLLGDDENEAADLGKDLTDPNLSLAPKLGFVRARKKDLSSGAAAVEPERDLGELLASAMKSSEVTQPDSSNNSVTLPLFASLPDSQQAEILSTMGEHSFAAQETLFRQGEVDGKLWFIRSGRIEIRRQQGNLENQLLARLGTGSVLGEMSIFDDSPRTATATALGTVTTYSMSRDSLEAVWSQYPEVREVLLKNYRLRHLRNLIAHAPFMQLIPEASRRGVAMLFSVREVAAGAILISGDESDEGGVFGVLGGRVRVEHRAPTGELRQIAIVSAGALFGYSQVLFGHREPFRCVTNGRASILRMSQRSMKGLLEAHPPLADYLLALSQRRLERAAEIIDAQDDFQG